MKEEVVRYGLKAWELDMSAVLDLGCGNGVAGGIAAKLGAESVDYSDPGDHAAKQFEKKHGRPCMGFGFDDVIDGTFRPKRYTLVICSYSLHFLKPSKMPAFMSGLRKLTSNFLVISPGNKPLIPETFWTAVGECDAKNGCKGRMFRAKTFMV